MLYEAGCKESRHSLGHAPPLVGCEEDTTECCSPDGRWQNSLAMDRKGHGEAGEAEASDLQERAGAKAPTKEEKELK